MYPLTATRALVRCGHSAATTLAVRDPQSNPAITAVGIFSESMRSMTSLASAACWPLRKPSADRNRVLP